MNLNRMTGAAVGSPMAQDVCTKLTEPYPSYINNAAQAQGPESELQYAARAATDSLVVLEKCVAELAGRMQAVLSQDVPTPTAGDGKAQRSVTSPIAQALLAHSAQTDSVTYMIRNLLNRLVL